ncbi:MAG TPA: amidohydrolase family protein [Chloroflexota bacterium]|nr:amidohydrolase family protein [Chloroflexota bacterium]
MRPYAVIDADSHIEEPEEMWEYLDPAYKDRRPITVTGENRPDLYGMNSFWFVDGKTYPHPVGRGVTIYATPVTMDRAVKKPFSIPSQTLSDPHARIKDMETAGVGVQVNFPTLFLESLTSDPPFESALMRAYNSYMAAQCGPVSDWLKWAALLPLNDVPAAVAEVRRAKELGASAAATTYGTLGDRPLEEPHLDPVWAELERQDLPLCIHCGWSNPGITNCFDTSYGAHVLGFTLPVLMAFYAFTGGGILDRFPKLKLAFLEAGCEWLPYIVQRMDHYYGSELRKGSPIPKRRASEYLRECQIYLTTEAEERGLPYVMEYIGEDRIMISADMPHGEARETTVEEIEERTDLSDAVKRKLLHDNAAAFYGVSA